MKEYDDFKMLRKGDRVRKYYNSRTTYRDFIVVLGGLANRDCLVSVRCIKSAATEWILIHDLVKLK